MKETARDLSTASGAFSGRDEARRFFDLAPDLLCIVGTDGKLLKINPAFEKTLGYKQGDLQGRSVFDYVAPDDEFALKKKCLRVLRGVGDVVFENRFRSKKGTYKWISWKARPELAQGEVYVVARDASLSRKVRQKLKHLAFTDELTGLLNRRGFYLFARQLSRICERQKKDFLVLLADVNDLKKINDRLGHAVGDKALIESARILKARLRGSDVVARIGGDEFAAAMLVESDLDHGRLRDSLHRAAEQTFLPAHGEPLTFSVGVSRLRAGQRLSLERMLVEADDRLYREKSQKNQRKVA
ncbi:MAG TPA: diguanylate cyclase [Verrucomicrobiae bacterium]|nr:diguanylate cyclase [Verrucomicrobiae bacterium]